VGGWLNDTMHGKGQFRGIDGTSSDCDYEYGVQLWMFKEFLAKYSKFILNIY
jgi:hypothetical protein